MEDITALEQVVAELEKAAPITEDLVNLYITQYQYARQSTLSLIDHYLDTGEILDALLSVNDRLDILYSNYFEKIAKQLEEQPVGQPQANQQLLQQPVQQPPQAPQNNNNNDNSKLSELDDISTWQQLSSSEEDDTLDDSPENETQNEDHLRQSRNGFTNTRVFLLSSSNELSHEIESSDSSAASVKRGIVLMDNSKEYEKHAQEYQSPTMEKSSDAAVPTVNEELKQDSLPLEGEIECPICGEEIPMALTYKFQQCGHTYCGECLQQYFHTKISERAVVDIKCPHPNCDTIVQYHELNLLVSRDMFEKYQDFSVLSALANDPNCRFCPKPDCGNAMIGDPQYKKMKCSKCNTEFCFSCNEEWHQGTCEEYQQWKVENGLVDAKYAEYIKDRVKQCPNCKAPTEKNDGCNHMTCAACRYEWCWLCGGKYTEYHFAPFNMFGCPGMQSKTFENTNALQSCRNRTGVRILMGTGIVVGGVLALGLAVPALVIGGPIYAGYKLIKKKKRHNRY